jgi:hypothetical protein
MDHDPEAVAHAQALLADDPNIAEQSRSALAPADGPAGITTKAVWPW